MIIHNNINKFNLCKYLKITLFERRNKKYCTYSEKNKKVKKKNLKLQKYQ